jgi:hypothetical protein
MKKGVFLGGVYYGLIKQTQPDCMYVFLFLILWSDSMHAFNQIYFRNLYLEIHFEKRKKGVGIEKLQDNCGYRLFVFSGESG